jgi:phosphatidate cytidylyltransferase
MNSDQPLGKAGPPARDAAGSTPAGPEVPVPEPAPRKPSRAGRDLPAAIGVGLGLLAVVLLGLLVFPWAFAALVAVFAVAGVWEVARALEVRRIRIPLLPAAVGSAAMPFAAYYGGGESLAFALVVTVTAMLLWRCLDSTEGAVRSIMSGVFVTLWVPFFLSFALLLFRADGGDLMVASMLLLVVANDTFGYLVGAFLGKHPMAPKISPKKSWEGFAGSVGGAVVIGVLASIFLLDAPWWFGLVLAVATVAAATTGDLAESMVKRELGIKDMGNSLPGHGGIMDRLDSILFAAPVAYTLSVLLQQTAA